MKYSILLLATVLIASIYLAQATPVDEYKPEYCSEDKRNNKDCMEISCNKANTAVVAKACAESRCAGKEIGIKHDPEAAYPACCPQPICDE